MADREEQGREALAASIPPPSARHLGHIRRLVTLLTKPSGETTDADWAVITGHPLRSVPVKHLEAVLAFFDDANAAKAHDAEVAVAALNAAADLWRNEGRAVMFNRDRLDLTPEGRVGKWLRDRASQYARADESNPR